VARHRTRWRVWQRFMDGTRFVFLDETAASTKMTRLRGWGPRGERLVDATPYGHVWTPPPVQEESLDRCCARSGAAMCPASDAARLVAAGPYGIGDQVHITGTRSKRYPCAWFS
jgi:hypothetical protein